LNLNVIVGLFSMLGYNCYALDLYDYVTQIKYDDMIGMLLSLTMFFELIDTSLHLFLPFLIFSNVSVLSFYLVIYWCTHFSFILYCCLIYLFIYLFIYLCAYYTLRLFQSFTVRICRRSEPSATMLQEASCTDDCLRHSCTSASGTWFGLRTRAGLPLVQFRDTRCASMHSAVIFALWWSFFFFFFGFGWVFFFSILNYFFRQLIFLTSFILIRDSWSLLCLVFSFCHLLFCLCAHNAGTGEGVRPSMTILLAPSPLPTDMHSVFTFTYALLAVAPWRERFSFLFRYVSQERID
jgi:hypothetical protein